MHPQYSHLVVDKRHTLTFLGLLLLCFLIRKSARAPFLRFGGNASVYFSVQRRSLSFIGNHHSLVDPIGDATDSTTQCKSSAKAATIIQRLSVLSVPFRDFAFHDINGLAGRATPNSDFSRMQRKPLFTGVSRGPGNTW
jgi:hypothetical protein